VWPRIPVAQVRYPGLTRLRRRMQPELPEFFRVLNRTAVIMVIVAGLQMPFVQHFTPASIAPWSAIMGGWVLGFGCFNAWWHTRRHAA
jgi:hypothetical protein